MNDKQSTGSAGETNTNSPENSGTAVEATNAAEVATMSEIDLLKKRAALMNITHSNNIGVEALKKKIAEKTDGEIQAETQTDVEEETEAEELEEGTLEAPENENQNPVPAALETAKEIPARPVPAPPKVKPVEQKLTPKMTLRQQVIKEQTRLVRLRIANLDPKKNDLPGAIVTVANSYMGTIKKYVPFGEFTDEGYHVPYCIYRHLEEKKFLQITTVKDRKNGSIRTVTRWAKEFAIEVLPDLTPAELAKLAATQAASGSVGNPD